MRFMFYSISISLMVLKMASRTSNYSESKGSVLNTLMFPMFHAFSFRFLHVNGYNYSRKEVLNDKVIFHILRRLIAFIY